MNDTLSLIQKLRGQLPPEAQEQLDELEAMAGGEEGEPGEEELGMDPEADPAGLFGSEDPMGEDADPLDLPAEDEDEEAAPAPAAPMPPKKKKPARPSFFS